MFFICFQHSFKHELHACFNNNSNITIFITIIIIIIIINNISISSNSWSTNITISSLFSNVFNIFFVNHILKLY